MMSCLLVTVVLWLISRYFDYQGGRVLGWALNACVLDMRGGAVRLDMADNDFVR